MKLTLKELREKRDALMAEVDTATEERFAEIKKEVAKIDFQIIDAEKRENAEQANDQKNAEERAGREPRAAADTTANKMAAAYTQGKTTGETDAELPEMAKADVLRYSKSAFGKELRSLISGGAVKYSDKEKRAIGVAFTTTAKDYKAPTATEDGTNNGGIFIRDEIMWDLLEIEKLDSPFLRDSAPTNITGMLIFPYAKERVLPEKNKRGKKEKEASTDLSIGWDKLTLAQGNYPLTIVITLELLALTDEAFAAYILEELRNEIDLMLGDEVFYGSGTDDHIEGVTLGAIKRTYTDPAAGFKDAFNTLSRRARKNAKLYISRSLSLDLTFEKDKNGQFLFPIYNAGAIETIARVPVEVDEGLEDGSFLYGNAKNYKLNFYKQTEVYTELKGRTRLLEITAHLMCAAKAVPNRFIYGTPAAGGSQPTGGGAGDEGGDGEDA